MTPEHEPEAVRGPSPAEEARFIAWEADARTKNFTYVSPRAADILGYPVSDWYADHFWVRHIHPDDRDEAVRVCDEAAARQADYQFEYRMTAADGRVVWLHDVVRAVTDPSGPRLLRGVMIEVSEQKRLEEALRQAAKMEAIGRLAGGIAHDFNNLLTVITGYCELVLGGGADEAAWRQYVQAIQAAGQRAADLTRQLLALSRKQVLRPRVLDLNQVVCDQEEALRRLFGDGVALSTALAPRLRPVKADPAQVGQVLLNLAANALDAMPQGGTLTVATREAVVDEARARAHPGLRPGPYAVLEVRDTGRGMDARTLGHLFEPFFTTKEVGKGTGLGLATAYGTVKQSGGHIEAASEVGRGSTFTVYLPFAEGLPAPAGPPPGDGDLPRGTETVLVVEDEDGVRAFTCHVLRQSGYTVLEAPQGADALAVCDRHPEPIHLVLTDVVMAGMSGPEFVRRLGERRPGLKVVFMSGYSDSTVLGPEAFAGGARLLEKPFTPLALARTVRDALDGGG
jgi:PAS domain S-box-containing protein